MYPPTGLALTWYRGQKVVENLSEPDCKDADEEELCNIVSSLSVKGTEVAQGVEFRCEVTLRVGQETFSRVASLVASAEGECQEGLGTTTCMSPIPWSHPQCPVPLRALPSSCTTPESLSLSLLALPLCSGAGGARGCSEVPCDQGCCVCSCHDTSHGHLHGEPQHSHRGQHSSPSRARCPHR